MVWTLYPSLLMSSPGSSEVSSTVRILCSRGNSKSNADNSELFPAPLAPQTSIVHLLSIRKDNNPASLGDTVPLATNLVRVHGLEERFLIATASPFGLIGYPTTVALASKSGKSVSRTGEEWQNLSPLSLFSKFTRLDTSLLSATRFVLHLRCEFRSPSTEFS